MNVKERKHTKDDLNKIIKRKKLWKKDRDR